MMKIRHAKVAALSALLLSGVALGSLAPREAAAQNLVVAAPAVPDPQALLFILPGLFSH